MVMSSWFSSAWDAVTQDGETEEERLAREAAQQQPPVDSPAGLANSGQFAASGLSTPATNQAWWTSPTAQNLLSAPAYTGDVPTAAPNYTGTYGPAFNITPGEQQVMQAQQDIMGNLGGGAFGVGNVTLGDVANYATNIPALNFVPGGNVLSSALDIAGVNQPTIGEAYAQDIPVVSPFMRDTVQPFAGDIGATAAQITDPFGVGSYLSEQVGGPSAQDVGRFAGEAATPVTAGDFALNAALAGGPLEAITGLPIDNLATSLRSGADNLFRAAMPEPQLYPGLSAGVPPINPRGGENVYGPFTRGAAPTDEAILAAQREAAKNYADDLARSVGAQPAPPAFPSSYPSIPEGTMGSEFPGLSDVQDAVRGGRAPSQAQVDALIRAGVRPETANARVRDVAIDPTSPAARMGAPLSGDPQFATPPPADAAMRDLGVGPNQQTFDVYHGSGRESQQSVYGYGDKPLFSDAGYYALDEKTASKFGPNVERTQVTLNNPYTIRNDADWYDLSEKAGMEYANPFGFDRAKVASELDKVPEYLQSQGYDGMVVNLNRTADYSKTARNIFGDDQVIQFGRPVDDTAQQMRDAFENVRRQEDILTGGGVGTPNTAERVAEIDRQIEAINKARNATDDNAEFNRLWQQEHALRNERERLVPAAERQGLMDMFEGLKKPTGGGVADVPTQATPPPASTGGIGGGEPPLPPAPPSAGDLNRVPDLNPVGTGRSRIEDAIANDPSLSDAAKDFLRSPNGQAAAEQRLNAIDKGFNPGDPNALPGGGNGGGGAGGGLPPGGGGGASGTPPGGGGIPAAGGGLPPRGAIQRQAQQAAQQMGMGQSLADRVVQNWLGNAQITQDFMPNQNQLTKMAVTVEHALTGNFSDSFVAGLVQRQHELSAALSKVGGLTPTDIAQRVDAATAQRIAEHYPNDPGKVAQVQKILADADARAKELSQGFKETNQLWDRVKSTLFPLDIGFFGQNVLTGMRQQGIPTLIGMANRVATAFHMGLPVGQLVEAQTNIPRILAAANDGLNLGREASGLAPKSGTILSYVPVIKEADKMAITPIIDKLTDAQFKGIGGFLKMMNYEGNLTIATALGKDITDPAVRREVARVVNNAWSSAGTAMTPGRAQLERLSLTSPAFTRSQLGQITDMAKLIAPGATETQRIMAATAVLSNVAMILGVYKLINDRVGISDGELDPLKPGFGQIVLPTTNSNGQHQVVNLFPQRSFQSAAIRAVKAIQEGDPAALKEAGAKLAAGRSGWIPSTIARGALGAGYDSNGKFYTGGMPTEERIKASLPIPITLQNPAFGQPSDPVTMAAELAGVPNYAESDTSKAFRERDQAADVRSQALVNGDLLRSAFPNDPKVAASLQGRSWDQLTYEEKNAITRAMPPEMQKQVQEADAASSAANKEKPTAIGNAIEIRKRTDETIDANQQKIKESAAPLVGQLFSADVDPRQVANTVSALRDIQQETLVRDLWAGSTTYTGLPWKDSNGKEDLPSEIEKAIAEYKMLGEVGKGADGKFNFDAYQAAKDQYLVSLAQKDPETADRLAFYIKERAAQTEANKPDIIKFYDFISDETSDYWKQPLGTRTEYRREHPVVDAYLVLSGWLPELASGKAAQIFHEMAPNRPLVVAKNAR